MYDITYQDRTLRLSDRDYKQLERRFNPERFKKDGSALMNRTTCICKNYDGCVGCPFYTGDVASCLKVFRQVAGRSAHHHVYLSFAYVYVYNNRIAAVEKVHDVLLTATKVSAH